MRVRRLMLWSVIFGLGLVVGTVIGYQVRPYTLVVAATDDLPAGTCVTRPHEQFTLKSVPTEAAPADAFRKIEDLHGKVLGRTLDKGAVCRVQDITVAMPIIGRPNSLPGGMRAITVRCELPESTLPVQLVGYRVDLICTMVDPAEPHDQVAVTFLENVQVLAVNGSENRCAVTVAAAPRDVARIVWAKEHGHIGLAVRPPGDEALVKPPPVTSLRKGDSP